MDDKFTARPKPVAVTTEKQPVSKSSDSSMAVSSMEYNHKMDGQSNSVKMSVGSEMEGVTSSSAGGLSVRGSIVSQPSLDMPTPASGQDTRHGIPSVKRKALENVYPATSSPVSQVIHVNAQKPKKGSFQITRVINRKQLDLDTVDHAEDADSIGDDFDETNTEDLSSEIMDTSKMTDIDQDPSSEDTVQSLAVEDLNRENKTAVPGSLSQTKEEPVQDPKSTAPVPAPVNLSASHDNTELTHTIPEGKENSDANFGPNRFRIVKVSNERFLRGRWTCHDYQDSERAIREKSNEDLGSGNSSAASSVHYVPGVDDPTKNPLSVTNVAYTENVAVPGLPPDTQPGHSVSQSQVTNGDYSAQSMTGGLGNALAQVSTEQPSAHELSSSIVQSVSAITQPISSQHSQQPAGTYTTSSVGASSGSGGQPNSQLPSQEYSSTTHQDYIGQQPSAQLSQQTAPQTIPQPQPSQQAPVAGGQDFNNSVPGNSVPGNSVPGDSLGDKTSLQPQGSSSLTDFTSSTTKQVVTSGNQSNTASPSDTIQTSDFRPTEGVYITPADDQQSTVSGEDDRVSESRLVKPSMAQTGLQPLMEMVQTMQYPLTGSRDPEDESGASTVAIDNKIEQAMDLVKSHLMFAVREEVLVLKDQIKELVEKNNQLEYENNLLRASATPETLSKLSQTPGQTQSSQPS